MEGSRYTFTVDFSYDYSRHVPGIGIVVQRSERPKRRGQMIAEYAEAYADIPSGPGESLAILPALEIAADLDCS